MTDNLSATGNIDYNRSSVKQDYNVPYFDQYGNKVFEDRGSIRDVYKSPVDVRLGFNYQTPQTNANISVNPRTRDLMARYNYSFADGGGVETLFRPKYAEGGQSFITGDYPISEHVIPIDPISIGSNTIPMMPASKSEISGSRIGEKKAMDELSNKGTPFEYGNIKGTIYPKEPIYNIKTEQPDLAITKLTSKETNFLKNQFYKNKEDLEIGDVHIRDVVPSITIGDKNLSLNYKDLPKFKEYLSDLRLNNLKKNEGEGMDKIPPGLNINSKQNLLRKLYQSSGGTGGISNIGSQRFNKDFKDYVKENFGSQPFIEEKAMGGSVGNVKTHLTRTIPPDSGPNPQGVETLFKRRYN